MDTRLKILSKDVNEAFQRKSSILNRAIRLVDSRVACMHSDNR